MKKSLLFLLIIIITILSGCSEASTETTTIISSTIVPTQLTPTASPPTTKTQGPTDLVWLEIPIITPLAPIVGDILNISQNWKNDSLEEINTSWNIKLQITREEIPVYEEIFEISPPVYKHQISSFSVSLENVLTEAGHYQVSITLDEESFVSETKENNNFSESLINVPDLSQTPTYSKGLDAAAVEQAIVDIETYRKGDVLLTVLDSSGEPCPDVDVQYRQVEHSFSFGVFEMQDDTKMWTLLGEAGINYIQSWFGWEVVEPEQGVYNLDPNYYISVIKKYGLCGMATCMLWLYDFSVPNYLKTLSFEEYLSLVYPHFFNIINAFKNYIKTWNVFNEPLQAHSNLLGFNQEQTILIIKEAIRAARDADPEVRVLINIYNAAGEGVFPSVNPFDFLEDAILAGVDYDITGLEFYYNAVTRDGLWEHPRLSLTEMGELIDRYSTLGKPIHITELSVPSEHAGQGYWEQPWSEEIQAEYLKTAYTIFFSKPSVENITWMNATDNLYFGSPFIYHGGILDEQFNPKISYYYLKKLIRDWTTSGSGTTDSKGQFSFRGFGGTYEIIVTDNVTGTTTSQLISIEEQKTNEISVIFK
ncbi:MAG: endo-1,4-beta-xylanase [Dehalococcoidales bacterium]|nr:endo-1,4-beta-xylanase [Dehalococcoidales bacterium]